MQIWKTITNILSDPNKFAKSVQKEKGIGKAYRYFIPLLAFNMFLTFLISRLTKPFIQGYFVDFFGIPATESYGLGFDLLIHILGFGLSLGLIFLVVGIFHVWVLLWGGNGPFSKTFQLYVYTSTPSWLFSWVPVFGGFIWIWDMVLLIMVTPSFHKDISKNKSLWMYIIPVIILFVIGILMLGALFFFVATDGLSNMVGQAFLA